MNNKEQLQNLKKIPELQSQLDDKANKNEIFSMANMGQDIKEAMTGGSVAVVGDNAVLNSNIVDNAVNGSKCSFIETKQLNIYNDITSIVGKQISVDGTITDNVNAKLSDFIKVKPNTSYTLNTTDTRAMCYYTNGKIYIGGVARTPSNGKFVFTTPLNCGYIRVAFTSTLVDIIVCETSLYDGIYRPYNTELITIKNIQNTFGNSQINENSVTFNKTDFVVLGKNLLNKINSTDGYISASNGTIVSSSTYRVTEFIKVEINKDYVISPRVRHFLAYDINKTPITTSYISTSQINYTFNTSSNIAYVRFSYYLSDENTMQLEVGTTPTGYERYCYKIPLLLSTETSNVLVNKTILNFGDSIMAGDGNNGKGVGKLIAINNGMVCTDYSKGGATVWFDDIDNTSTDEQTKRQNIQYQIDQAIANVSNVDYILIDGGTNDISVTAPLGVITDGFSVTLDKYTFSGGLELCFKNLKNKYPTAKLIYIRVHNMGSRSYLNQVLYGERAIAICEKWSVEVVDLFKKCGLNTNMSIYEQYTNNSDKTHPNQIGYDTFYLPLITNTMKKLI